MKKTKKYILYRDEHMEHNHTNRKVVKHYRENGSKQNIVTRNDEDMIDFYRVYKINQMKQSCSWEIQIKDLAKITIRLWEAWRPRRHSEQKWDKDDRILQMGHFKNKDQKKKCKIKKKKMQTA